MRVYVVGQDGYDGGTVLGVWSDEVEAIAFARAEARKTNEEWGGMTGDGVYLRVWDTDDPTAECATPDWQDWKTKIEGAHFVIDTVAQ